MLDSVIASVFDNIMGRFFFLSLSSTRGKSFCIWIIERDKGYSGRFIWEENVFSGFSQQWMRWLVWTIVWSLSGNSETRKVHSFAREVAILMVPIWPLRSSVAAGCHSLPEGKKKWGWCGFGGVLHFLLSPFITVKQVHPGRCSTIAGSAWFFCGPIVRSGSLRFKYSGQLRFARWAQGLSALSSSSPSPMAEVQHARTNQGTVAKTYMEDVVVLPSK